jgi:hypothetical protein
MGVRFLARALVRAFVETNATGFIEWPLTNGAYEHLPFMNNILPSKSTQPWCDNLNRQRFCVFAFLRYRFLIQKQKRQSFAETGSGQT